MRREKTRYSPVLATISHPSLGHVTVRINGKAVEPVARDRVAAVCACAECVSGVTVTAPIDIGADDADVVLF